MRTHLQQVLAAFTGAALCLFGMAAFGGDGVNLSITNDGTEDIFVTVSDATTQAPLIEHARINGFSSLSVAANADATGLASISWTAISVDNRDKHCGRGTRTGLDNDAVVNVHADSSC